MVFFAVLRISELVSANKTSVSSLEFRDILVLEDSIQVFVKRSKTDQLAKGDMLEKFMLL